MKRLNWAKAAGMLLVTTTFVGCGGFSSSPSVSPASFLLPGLLRVTPPTPSPGTPTNWVASVEAPADSFRN